MGCQAPGRTVQLAALAHKAFRVAPSDDARSDDMHSGDVPDDEALDKDMHCDDAYSEKASGDGSHSDNVHSDDGPGDEAFRSE